MQLCVQLQPAARGEVTCTLATMASGVCLLPWAVSLAVIRYMTHRCQLPTPQPCQVRSQGNCKSASHRHACRHYHTHLPLASASWAEWQFGECGCALMTGCTVISQCCVVCCSSPLQRFRGCKGCNPHRVTLPLVMLSARHTHENIITNGH